ncbi:UNVERIFIED_CONTAM: hypothetical protein FKN15_038617 [Acipenser sinensis]
MSDFGICASVFRSVLTLRRVALRRFVSALCSLVQRFGALCSASALCASASALGDSVLDARRFGARCTHLDARRLPHRRSTLGAPRSTLRRSTLCASAPRCSVHAPRCSTLRRSTLGAHTSTLDARCTHLDARRFGASTLGARTSTFRRLMLVASTPRRSVHAPRRLMFRRNDARCTHLDAQRFGARRSVRRRLDVRYTHLDASTLGARTSSSHVRRVRKVVGSHSPSSGSSYTLSVPPSSTATPSVTLRVSKSPSQLTAGQRSPDRRRAHERSHSPSIRPRGSSPRRERSRWSRSRSLSPRRRGRSRSSRRDRRYREKSGVAELTSKMSQFMDVMMGQQSLLMSLTSRAPPAESLASHSAFQPQPLVVPVVQQPQGVWDVDAISRDASEGEPLLEEDSPETDLASQHS